MPSVGQAQQSDQVKRVGVLTGFAETDAEAQRRLGAFLKGLHELGWIDGSNTRLDYRWGSGDPERIRAYAADLAHLKPDVILVNSSTVLKALHEATRTIPIVFVQVTDPVGTGFVESLARPGGNITGFINTEFSTAAKWLELLKEIAPNLTRIAVMSPPDWPPLAGLWRAIEGAASSSGVQLTAAGVHDANEIEQAIEAFAREPDGGLIVAPNPTTNVHRKLIIDLAARYRLPAIYAYRYFVREGGLICYGVDPADLWHAAATYVDRILKGAKPGELPVQQPTKFELALNLKTANTLRLTIPQSILLRAVEVIE